jgi:hypothetical protein
MALGAAWARLVAAARQVRTALHDLLARRRSVAELVAALAAWLRAVVANLRTWGQHAIAARRSGDGESVDVARDDAAPVTAQQRSLRELWQTFIGYTSVRRPQHKTPGEIATHAIEADGLPAEPVRTLRDAVRAVEFGAVRAEAYLPRATDALATIETAVESTADNGTAETDTAPGSGAHSPSDTAEPAADSEMPPDHPDTTESGGDS